MQGEYGVVFDFGLLNLQWPTALLIFFLFFSVMFFLNTWLFKPILRTLENRTARLQKLQNKKEENSIQLEQSQKTYEEKLRQVQSEVSVIRGEARAEASRKAKAIVEKVRDEIQEKLTQAESELRGEFSNAERQMKNYSQSLGELIASKVLA